MRKISEEQRLEWKKLIKKKCKCKFDYMRWDRICSDKGYLFKINKSSVVLVYDIVNPDFKKNIPYEALTITEINEGVN